MPLLLLLLPLLPPLLPRVLSRYKLDTGAAAPRRLPIRRSLVS